MVIIMGLAVATENMSDVDRHRQIRRQSQNFPFIYIKIFCLFTPLALPSILFSFPAFFLSSGSTSRIKELKGAYPSVQLSSPVGIETLHLSAPSEFMSNTRKLSENFLTTLKSREIVINNTSHHKIM